MFSLFYLLVKTTKRDFGNIKHAEIKQVLSFKQVSVTLSNFLNRKNKKQEKNRFQNLPINKPKDYVESIVVTKVFIFLSRLTLWQH